MLKKTFQNKMDAIRKTATQGASMGKKVATMPGTIIKKQWNKNQAFRNKNSTRAKFEQNSK
jgi:hypothetical protein